MEQLICEGALLKVGRTITLLRNLANQSCDYLPRSCPRGDI